MNVFLIVSLLTSPAVFGGDLPWVVVVIGESPALAQLRVPENVAYKFQYDPTRNTLWEDIDMQGLVTSGVRSESDPAGLGYELDLSDFTALVHTDEEGSK